jgi:hypothetical protein
LEPCPECSVEVCIVWQGYRIDWPELPPGERGDAALMVMPGGQVLIAGSGDASKNRYRFHEHQPEGLE